MYKCFKNIKRKYRPVFHIMKHDEQTDKIINKRVTRWNMNDNNVAYL
jgi:hypothetical protein